MTLTDLAARVEDQLLHSEGEHIVRDMATHVGDQIFDILRRNGMVMSTASGSVGVCVLAAAYVLSQADDFLKRSLDGEADEVATLAVAQLFIASLPESIALALAATSQEKG